MFLNQVFIAIELRQTVKVYYPASESKSHPKFERNNYVSLVAIFRKTIPVVNSSELVYSLSVPWLLEVWGDIEGRPRDPKETQDASLCTWVFLYLACLAGACGEQEVSVLQKALVRKRPISSL